MINAVTREGEIVEIPDLKTPFNHDTNAESDRTATLCEDESKTQQNQAAETDINEIVRRFGITGQLPNLAMPPTLGDFDEVFDFQSAMNVLTAAKQSFAALPPDVRATFGNDPHQFVAYCDAAVAADDLDQLRKWGLAVPEPPAPPDPEKEKPAGE